MSAARLDRAGLVARTAVHLRPAQAVHRARLRSQRAALGRWGEVIASHMAPEIPLAWGWPPSFVPLDAVGPSGAPAAEANARGTFGFLAETRQLGDPPEWHPPGASQLWRYNLHYWEWAWAFTTDPDRLGARAAFARLWRSWSEGTRFGQWDEWSPYVVSLRTWVLCGVYGALVRGRDCAQEYVQSVALHGRFVAANLERDVGGNHLIKNLKALLGAGIFLGDESMIGRSSKAMAGQVDIQILPDGGHFERSPSYHCQVLGDLIDIEALLRTCRRPPIPGVQAAIERMRRWLGAMMQPDGSLALLNDCTPVAATRLAALGPAQPPTQALTVLEASGYVIVRTARWHLIADIGLPCPPDLPAHAHADSLSFVLCLDQVPVLIDTGTSEYAPGRRRYYERSTAAHNTLELDGTNSTEVWGAFRAGRRATPTLDRAEATPEVIVVAASHDGYRHLSGRPVHRRTWRVTNEFIDIADEVTGGDQHRASVRLHSPAACEITQNGARFGFLDVEVVGSRPGSAQAGEGDLATACGGFGLVTPAGCFEVEVAGPLPLRVALRLRSVRPADLAPVACHSHANPEGVR